MGEKLRILGLKRYEKIKDVLTCQCILHENFKEYLEEKFDEEMERELIKYLKKNKDKFFSFDFESKIYCNDYFDSNGWIDLRCGLGEPGQEYRETVESLCDSLTASGFAHALIMPNTDPVIQTKNEVDFVLNKSKSHGANLLVMGAVTRNAQGEDLTEILDMHFQSGLRFFGDGIKTLSNSDRYMKILQYLQKFDGVLFDHAYDPLLGLFGQMHEGEISTKLGMKGFPNLA
jgi:dihydroorotase